MYDFTMTPDEGEPYDITATSRDIAVWERTGYQNSLKALLEAPTMKAFYSLAYTACRRQGRTVPDSLDGYMGTTDLVMREKVRSLDRDELREVVALAMLDGDPEMVTDRVMDLLEALSTRSTDPTRPGR